MANLKTLKHLLAQLIARRKTPRLEGDDLGAVQAWLLERPGLVLILDVSPTDPLAARAMIVEASDLVLSSGELAHMRKPLLWDSLLEACALFERTREDKGRR